MTILNTQKEKRKGLWTRIQGESKSVIDYVIVDKAEANNIEVMEIDEKKEWTPFRVIKENGRKQTKYTDHSALKVEMKQKGEQEGDKDPKKIMTKKSYRKFKELINQEKVSEIIKENKQQGIE